VYCGHDATGSAGDSAGVSSDSLIECLDFGGHTPGGGVPGADSGRRKWEWPVRFLDEDP
jgi:hypothetical protein